jgi:hypothetical protein
VTANAVGILIGSADADSDRSSQKDLRDRARKQRAGTGGAGRSSSPLAPAGSSHRCNPRDDLATGRRPATFAHRWSFTVDEAERLARTLLDAAQRVRDMTIDLTCGPLWYCSDRSGSTAADRPSSPRRVG